MDKLIQKDRSGWHGRPSLWVASHLAVGVVAFLLATSTGQGQSPPATPGGEVASVPVRVTGIGGVFFTSADPGALLEWYRTHLGIDAADWGGFAFQWEEKGKPDQTGYTVWGAFPDTTEYFAPSPHPYMINFRVADLSGLIDALRAARVQIVGEIEQHPNGAFAWVLDPEGRKIELWQPVPSRDDPYLR